MMKKRLKHAHKEGFRQGMWTTLLIASPFIISGIKWLSENRDTMSQQMTKIKDSEFYTHFFNKEIYEENQANKQLQSFRAEEGNLGDESLQVSDDDRELLHIIKEITKKELTKE